MKNASTLKLPQHYAALDNLQPAFGLLYIQPADGYQPGDVRPIYGTNLAEESIYTNGSTPKGWRTAADNGDFESELLFCNLPETMEEIVPQHYPGIMEVVLTNARIIQAPEMCQPVPVPMGKVIEHPATTANKFLHGLKKLHKAAEKNTDTGQLFLFPETEPLTQTA